MPAPLTFRGMPAPRFWELEDALIDYGLTPVGPTDLAHLMMIEYANSYGNDWFVVPLTLPIGSLTRVDSLVVTDSFGVRSLLRPIGDRSLAAIELGDVADVVSTPAGPGADREAGFESLLPAAHVGTTDRGRGARGCALHARRDGQPRVGDRARHRESARAAHAARGARSGSRRPPRLPQPRERRRAIGSRRAFPATGSPCCRCKPKRRTARSSRGCDGVRYCSPTGHSACTAR